MSHSSSAAEDDYRNNDSSDSDNSKLLPLLCAPFEEDHARIETALSVIYCRAVFSDFRRPVELLYPSLAKAYLRIIQQPMDVGTLLLKAMNREFTSFPEMLSQLKLVHQNAVAFNDSSPTMVAMSNHLKMFAAGAVEEIVRHRYEATTAATTTTAAVKEYVYPVKSVKPYLEKRSRRFHGVLPQQQLLQKRRSRLKIVETAPLNRSELGHLLRAIHELTSPPQQQQQQQQQLPPVVVAAAKAAVNLIAMRLQAPSAATAADVISDGDELVQQQLLLRHQQITLRSVLLPLVRSCLHSPDTFDNNSNNHNGSSNNSSSGSCLWPDVSFDIWFRPAAAAAVTTAAAAAASVAAATAAAAADDHHGPLLLQHPAVVPFLQQLDDALGVLLVKLQERVLRGTSSSSVWARPSIVFIWAQPVRDSKGNSRSPWCPCMLLASGFDSSSCDSQFALSATFTAANLARIPLDILQQLAKVRPRGVKDSLQQQQQSTTTTAADATATTTNSSNNNSNSSSSGGVVVATAMGDFLCPEGFLLLEFFGSHDFGWMRADAVIPVTSVAGERLPQPPGKLAAAATLREADEAIAAWTEQLLQHGEAAAEDVDLLAPPSLAELEESVEVPLHHALFFQPSTAAAASGGGGGEDTVDGNNNSGSGSGALTSAAAAGNSSSSKPKKKPAAKRSSKSSSSSAEETAAAAAAEEAAFAAAQLLRADVDYVVASECSNEELLQHCIVDGTEFSTSRCPLPMPLLAAEAAQLLQQRQKYSASAERAAAERNSIGAAAAEDQLKIKRHVKANFKANAQLRARAFSLWAETVKPLLLSSYEASKGPRLHNGKPIDEKLMYQQQQQQQQQRLLQLSEDAEWSNNSSSSSSDRRGSSDSLLDITHTITATAAAVDDDAAALSSSGRIAGCGRKWRDFATDVELRSFRSDAEFISAEEATAEYLAFRCFPDSSSGGGGFHASLCPLPLPLRSAQQQQQEWNYRAIASASRAKSAELTSLGAAAAADRAAISSSTRANFKANALMRTKAASLYFEEVKPLNFQHFVATKGPRSENNFLPPSHHSIAATTVAAATAAAVGGSYSGGNSSGSVDDDADAASDVASDDSSAAAAAEDDSDVDSTTATTAAAADDSQLRLDSVAKRAVGSITDPPTKRKYVFKNRNLDFLTAEAADATALFPVTTTSAAATDTAAAAGFVPSYMIGSSSNSFTLECGVTRFAGGEGSVYTRSAPATAAIFYYESRSCGRRKKRLRSEFAALTRAINQLQQLQSQRQQRDEQKKWKHEQLQQQAKATKLANAGISRSPGDNSFTTSAAATTVATDNATTTTTAAAVAVGGKKRKVDAAESATTAKKSKTSAAESDE